MIPQVSDREDYWKGYLRLLADKMELRDWSVGFIDEAPHDGSDAEAQSECSYGRKCITIRVGRHFQDRTPDRQRATMVHELLHAHFTRTFQTMKNHLTEVNEQWFRSVDLAVSMDLEYAIDAIADGWGKSLPLPPTYKPGLVWRAVPDGIGSDNEDGAYSSPSVNGFEAGDDDGRAPTPTPPGGASAPTDPSPDRVQAPTSPTARGDIPWPAFRPRTFAWRPAPGSDPSAY